MGMFDYVNVEMPCPNCGNPLKEFQSKSHDCLLAVLDPTEVDYFYDYCKGCSAKVAFLKPSTIPDPARFEPFSRQEVEALGFELQLTIKDKSGG